MKRSAVIYSLAVLFLVHNAEAEEKNVDFTGTWILDIEKSDPDPKPVNVMNMGGTPVDVSRGGMGSGGYSVSIPVGGMKPQRQDPTTPLVIKQIGKELEIITGMNVNDRETLITDHYTLDGKKREKTVLIPDTTEGVQQTVKATLNKRKFKLEIKTPYPQGESTLIKEFSLSKDGRTLKLEISNSMSVRSRVPTLRTEQKQVYHRQ